MEDGIEICFNNNTTKTKYLNIELAAYFIEMKPNSSWKIIIYDNEYDFNLDGDNNYCLFLAKTVGFKAYEGIGNGEWRLDMDLSHVD